MIFPEGEYMRDLATEVENGLIGNEGGKRSVVLFCKDGPSLQELSRHEMFTSNSAVFEGNI